MEPGRCWAPSRVPNPLQGFDEDGVLWWLGTAGGTRPWRNPCEGGAVTVRCSAALDAGTAAGFVGRHQASNFTEATPDEVAVTIVLPRALAPTHYALRHGWANEFGSLRNWELLGSNDGVEFTVLREHRDDESLNAGYATATWAVAPPPGTAFTEFTLRVTGRNKAGDNSLWLAGIELYGQSAAAANGGGGGATTAAPASMDGWMSHGACMDESPASMDVVPVEVAGAESDPPNTIPNESEQPGGAAFRAGGGGSGLPVAAAVTVTTVPGTEAAAAAGWQRRRWAAGLVAVLSAVLWQAGPVMDTVGQWMVDRHDVIPGTASLLGVDVVLLAVAGAAAVLTAGIALHARRRRQHGSAATTHPVRPDLASVVPVLRWCDCKCSSTTPRPSTTTQQHNNTTTQGPSTNGRSASIVARPVSVNELVGAVSTQDCPRGDHVATPIRDWLLTVYDSSMHAPSPSTPSRHAVARETPARGPALKAEEEGDGARGRHGGSAGGGGGGTATPAALPPLPTGTMSLPGRAALLRRWVTDAEGVVAGAQAALGRETAAIHAQHQAMIVQHGRDQQLAVDATLQKFNLLVSDEADCRDQEIERVHRDRKVHLANAAATLRSVRGEVAEAERAGTFMGWLRPRPIVYGGDEARPGIPGPPGLQHAPELAPQEFRCGLSGDVMADPVIAQCGHSFERHRLEASLRRRRRCPECQVNIPGPPTANHSLRATIDRWHRDHP